MQKTIKIIAGLIGGLVLLIIAAVVAVVTFINPNDYKDQISQKVQQTTGRQLTLQGDIQWSFFPWLRLEINQVQLSNAPGFGAQPFAVIKKADVSVELLPLLKGKVELGKILLDGLELRLVKNAKGVTNWQDLLDRSNKKKAATPTTETTSSPAKSAGYFSAFALAGVDIKDGHIIWQDQQQNKSYDISDLQLQSRGIKTGESFPVKFGFVLQGDKIKNLTVGLQSDVTVDTDQQTLSLQNLQLAVANLIVRGDVDGQKIMTDPVITGNVEIPNFNLRQFMATLGKPVGVAPETLALKKVSAHAQIKATSDSLQMTQLHAQLDNNTLTGNVFINGLATKVLNAKGQIQADSLQVGKFNPTKVSLQFKATNNLISLNPITANIYQGTYQGVINVDISGATPRISSDTQFNNIQIESLMRDLTTPGRVQLIGVGSLTAHLTTQADNVVNYLSGQGKIALKNGVLKGINIPYWINTGRALLKKQAPPAEGSNQTDFGNLTGTFTVTNGIVKNNDLYLRSTNVEANGGGVIDLVNQSLDYKLDAQLLRTNGQPDGTVIPLLISGPFSNIKVRPNVEGLLKEQIKEKIGAEIGKHLDKDLGDKLQNTLDSLFK